ncbi:protein TIFY 6A isoform X1 [Arachis stenosperma]|uniref:protein TIFY 6A isoform X1 n=1 Tax=Arachis stenosperma TaxID=217475 RepID=UPI0025ABCFD5|nr:protein TIFY 6A isoform X1 [Arachis stenosperma]
MERDFMGLSSKEPLVVKEEINDDGSKDSGFTKGSTAQWLFSSKVSAVPHLMSFKVSQDEKPFDSTLKFPAPELQKSFNHNGQGGFHFSMTPHPVQHDVNSVNRPHDVKMFSVSNQAISVSVGNPYLKNHFASAAQNIGSANVKQTLLGGIPITPTIGAVAERNVKTAPPSAQLTIFYAGTVNVFQDISAEKAQAIMLLAGNELAQPKVQAAGSKLGAGDSVPVNQPPCSGVPSPLSVSSHSGAQSGSGSTSTDEFLTAKTTGVPTGSVSKVEPPKVVSATTMLTSAICDAAVPQARKASLARFLEKRKERVMNSAPYNLNKKSEEYGTAEHNGATSIASNALPLQVKQG